MSSIEHLFDGSSVEFTYGFNDAHQVESQTVSDAQHMWHPSTTGTTTYTTANEENQYPSVGGKDFTYNRNGCLTSDGTCCSITTRRTISPLPSGAMACRLTSTIQCTGRSKRKWAAQVRHASSTAAGSGWQRLADYDGEDTLENRYVYGTKLDEPLIQVSGTGDLSYFHHDRLGSIVAITDDTGAVLNRYAYSSWGECDDMSGTTFGFTGQRYDAESGLYFYKTRHLAPTVGRFLQPDWIGTSGGLNLYTYVGNDGLNLIDQFGFDGVLTIYSETTGIPIPNGPLVRTGSHSWLTFKPDGGALESYGTYGDAAASRLGLPRGGMLPRVDIWRVRPDKYGRVGFDRSRKVRLNQRREDELNRLLDEEMGRGSDAWTFRHPCSSFASEIWEKITGERLSPMQRFVGIVPQSTPLGLGNSIFEANGNAAAGELVISPNVPQFISESPMSNWVVGESD